MNIRIRNFAIHIGILLAGSIVIGSIAYLFEFPAWFGLIPGMCWGWIGFDICEHYWPVWTVRK